MYSRITDISPSIRLATQSDFRDWERYRNQWANEKQDRGATEFLWGALNSKYENLKLVIVAREQAQCFISLLSIYSSWDYIRDNQSESNPFTPESPMVVEYLASAPWNRSYSGKTIDKGWGSRAIKLAIFVALEHKVNFLVTLAHERAASYWNRVGWLQHQNTMWFWRAL